MSLAIITGASSGIGREFAKRIKETGQADRFLLIARRREKLADLAAELGEGTEILAADLATPEGIKAVRTYLEENKPRVRYLINAAGYGVFGDYTQVSEKDTIGMIDLNVKALVLISHMVIPYMERGSNLLEVGSASVFTPLPGFNIYASGKAFVYHYSQALAYEVKEKGIAVTVFCPGWVRTDFFDRAENERSAGPRNKKPMLSVEYVVACAMRAMEKRKLLCTCNWYTKMQHLLSKIAPNPWLIRMWISMCKK
ncbi:MAG: SDR family NAD(P)-dependent oxidoreductase [Clostridia bacterium]|nr:SDR family NAD(P)-dependent oxidoreductase [Clostridia bacterium]